MKYATRKSNKLENIEDMEAGYSLSHAIDEASRCLLCYDAPCSKNCPAGTDPGAFIRKLRLRNIKGAVRTVKRNNILGGVCGVACPAAKLCREACSATEIDRPIEVGRIQRFLVEYGWDIGFEPQIKEPGNHVKVAVVGSGPAGLTCAAELAKAGYDATVFEEREQAGGVLRYGVPEFRLNGEFLDREIEDVEKLGVRIECGSKIDAAGVDDLLEKGYEAVFLAPGLWSPYRVPLPGADLDGVTTATEFLEETRGENTDEVSPMVRDVNVAVIGGGSVAMDVANTCRGLGSKRVYCICLESLAEIPAAEEDLAMARDNYVVIKPQCRVTEIIGEKGRVTGLRGIETEWIEPGLFIPSNARDVSGTEFRLNVGAVVMAIGSGAAREVPDMCSKVHCGENRLIETREDGVSTGDGRIFAGGDVVRGPALIADAVADGKNAAGKIIEYLEKKKK